MADQVIEQYMYTTGHQELTPRADASTSQVVSPHDQYDDTTGRKHNHGPQTPSGSSDNEVDKRSRRPSPRRRRRSTDSSRSRSRSPERRRYFDEYRLRRRFEPDSYRHWSYGYLNDWRPRGRRFSWWRGSSRGYGGPRYGHGRGGWYGGFDRKPARFYHSERYPSRRYEYDNFEYARERVYRRRDSYDEDRRSRERVHRAREEYDEDRRSRRSHDRERTRRDVRTSEDTRREVRTSDDTRREVRTSEDTRRDVRTSEDTRRDVRTSEDTRREGRTSEDTRSQVTSSRTIPSDEYKDVQRPAESTYVNNNYTEMSPRQCEG